MGKSLSAFNIIPPTEQRLLEKFNDTSHPFAKDLCVIDAIEKQARLTPNSIALIFEGVQINYRNLNERANQLANYLRKKAVLSETIVPVCLDRSIDMIVCILGILKAGGAYLPLDPGYPTDRINFMLQDSKASLIISNTKCLANMSISSHINVLDIEDEQKNISLESKANLPRIHNLKSLAYIMYTSGSTGKPKGVMIEHTNITSFIAWCHNEFSSAAVDIVYASTSISFDLSVFEIFYPLSVGKMIRIVENGMAIKEHLENDSNVLLNTVPAVIENLITEQVDLRNVSLINMCGEPVPQFVKDNLDLERIEVRNLYGPTENTIYTTLYRLTKNKPILIGKPINNTAIYITNKNNEQLPIGVKGEICIAGAGIARGYLQRPELTAEKFTYNTSLSKNGATIYKTGDLGRWLVDGNLEFLGRIDNQVKINGHRVELGEIEAVLLKSNMVLQAVVKVCQTLANCKQLAAYVVPKPGSYNKEEVTRFLQSKLPQYMLPSHYIELDKMPQTSSGKINRNALPEVTVALPAKQDYQHAQNTIEAMLCAVWQDLFKRKQVGTTHNFFDLGGDSIMAIRIIARLKKLGYTIDPKDIFLYQNIKALALFLQDKSAQNNESRLPFGTTVNLLKSKESQKSKSFTIFEIKKGTGKIPLYIVCGKGGTLFAFTKFVELLNENQQVFVIQQPTKFKDLQDFPTTITGIAERYISEMLHHNPNGQFALSGHCLGGLIAFEMAKQLEAKGKEVKLLALFDTVLDRSTKRLPLLFEHTSKSLAFIHKQLYELYLKIHFHIFLFTKHPAQAIQYKLDVLNSFFDKLLYYRTSKTHLREDQFVAEVQKKIDKSVSIYNVTPYSKTITFFLANEHYYFFDHKNNIRFKKFELNNIVKRKWQNDWMAISRSADFYFINGEHSTIFNPSVGGKDLAFKLQELLNKCALNTDVANKAQGSLHL